uniref:Uncharacterized protein n=1 Tax=Timema douglasi TaxID=61478 RepID=A0A7R8VQX2_TIMDO|nr:unnamed protein product [Timema douglasi]
MNIESAHILVTILVAIEHSLRVVSEKLINACILVKSHSFVRILVESNPEQSSEVLRWLERYKLEREEKTPSKTPTKITQKRYKTKKREIENENTSSPLKKPKFRKDLSNEMEQQENCSDMLESAQNECVSSFCQAKLMPFHLMYLENQEFKYSERTNQSPTLVTVARGRRSTYNK